MERSSDKLPGYLNFQIHAEAQSLWNTAPTFPIYVFMLVTKWLITDIGGLANMEAQNRRKAKLLYDVIDQSNGFYVGHSQPSLPLDDERLVSLAERGIDGEVCRRAPKSAA